MAITDSPELAQQLKKLKAPLDTWRRKGRAPRRIPEPIWEQATILATEHGVGVVAKSLGLDHAKLKAKVIARCPAEVALTKATPPETATFVEFLPPPAPVTRAGSCILQVESHRGARLRVETDLDVSELSTLLRDFGR